MYQDLKILEIYIVDFFEYYSRLKSFLKILFSFFFFSL